MTPSSQSRIVVTEVLCSTATVVCQKYVRKQRIYKAEDIYQSQRKSRKKTYRHQEGRVQISFARARTMAYGTEEEITTTET